MFAAVVWAFVQPWRVTLLHPHGQGFWWLVVEPPLLVVLAGVVFAVFIAPGVIEDLEDARGRPLMQPPAELVHWMFATGFLLLGLCLLAEGIVGPEVWRVRAWRAYLWPSLVFAMGVLMWPVMVFFTNSTIHMLAHGSWAQVLMLAGAAELGLVRGKLHSPYWRLTMPFALLVSGTAFLDPRAEQLVLRPLGLPPPPDRLDADRLRDLPARLVHPAALGDLALGLRARGDHARRPALLRPRCRADLRPPLTARGRAPPVKRLQVTVCYLLGVALAFPALASAHATLTQTKPSFTQRLASSPRVVMLRFDQSVDALPNAITVFTAKGRIVSGKSKPGTDRRIVTVPVQHLARGAYTVRWRVVSADSHVVAGVFTFGVRQRAPPATQAFGASGPTNEEHVVRWLYFLALALLIGGLGFRLLVVRGPMPPRAERRFYWIVGIGAIGCDRGRGPRVPAARPRTRCSSRSWTSSTAISRRLPAGRASAPRSSR